MRPLDMTMTSSHPISTSPAGDHLVLIQVLGMHCHRCEHTLRKTLNAVEGVHEVEVDFPSSQMSVLHDRSMVDVATLVEAVADAGYRVGDIVERGI